MGKLTIKDIAKQSGFSVSTVSNVINGKGKCSLETQKKIFSLMEEVGYKPNCAARTLASKKSNLIGILFPVEDEIFRKNNSYQKIVNSITSELSKKSYDLVIGNNTKELDILEWALKRDLEGIVIVGDLDPEKDLKKINIPIVFIDNYKNNLYGVNYINSDDTIGGFDATEILAKNNCKNIGFVGSEDIEVHSRRYLGYQSALIESSLGEERLYLDQPTYQGGLILGEMISKTDIDGLCIASDIMAFGIISSLLKNGKKIPEDIKIIGFDNIDSCRYTTPTLSSVDLNFSAKGIMAVQMIFEEIEGKTFLRNQSIDLNIVLRESTGNKN
ncbi:MULTISPECIES: LacI family DNA-binding transcriptional regulator [Psychrilyobacter]|uniref:LacI family DNA-binding transcriptional regulator n=1 Tax=Psychrilyobacter piezotolerans TaxID=2293438 RepID=A0ABX9KJ82_9FUSO|nr:MULTISPECIES: LacI family DNA-binding transcriptional regulator [Psychrilyobacter]MCS5421898.1 LacI family transcriptional regulator [Psychrilyobacter sp. S5]NDI76948.1 LacI family transcriptional regulator [Psychrilyobacter piezotolerans]RDE64571.1 LacI family transcriptional regulator [Psychrilyobacter sp. S5]REI42383.1 LacI family DNA-binding transcriptional regulator [Psychrilyobacter piezotolerans]